MYLEKLEIQGFKSFAKKNILVFPGMLSRSKRGITAIVGPNGSGKSNVADAIRWALGEQSMKILRGKKGEDVIFSGSDKKGSLGMSEVSLHLNNEKKIAPIDYSQVVVTRRLFRNGESEYMLNGNKVRLYDIQMLLAKAKFGQKTYSVIGQGVVEGFLNSSLSERKEFFDEATGVKQFQIKRDNSLNKLCISYENLTQAQMLITEIEPRLKSLTRQVNKLKKGEEIETQLRQLQLNYYSQIWHNINNKFSSYNKQLLNFEGIKRDKERKIAKLNGELNKIETDTEDLAEFFNWQQELTEAQNQKDILTKQLAKTEAQLEVRLEANGQFDLSWLSNKKTELTKEVEVILEEINMLVKNIEPEKEKLPQLEKEKDKIDSKINKLNHELTSSGSVFDNEAIEQVHKRLKQSISKLEQAEQESDIKKIKNILEDIKKELKLVLSQATEQKEKNNIEKIQQDIIKLTSEKEQIITSINETNLRISARSERVKLLKEKKSGLANELADIKTKLSQDSEKLTSEELVEVKEKLNKINKKITNIKEKITEASSQEKSQRNRLFDLQKNMQVLQNEINDLNNQINEIKINSTRYETRLEDLEIEIRHNSGDLKKVKNHTVKETTDQEQALEKINQLKRQLDLIGGIDPEIEKEYKETKERYDFLSGQVNDLIKAIDSLKDVVKELDLTIKERFDKEFKIIRDKFEEYFRILFNGGKAKIIKVVEKEKEEIEPHEDVAETRASLPAQAGLSAQVGSHSPSLTGGSQDDNVIDIKKIKFLQKHNATGLAGIEIQACPPGKKIKSINMLSGGERALTAIALICAIISANPSPFVVLDEVDAALDEANSERFAKILDDLSHKTQFIIITHNRASMRRANILYGVTMGDDGVSKLLSIKLEEAKKVESKK